MKKIKIFDLKEQYKIFNHKIERTIMKVIRSGSYILGENVKSFEERAKEFLDSKYVISCNSGTDALILSLRAKNIGNNDEVITSPFTYFATAEAISIVGAKPIFVDINPHTFNINPKKIEKAISKKTKAIISVNLFGQASQLDLINKIAKCFSIPHIEDCAQSFGCIYKNKQTGTYGDMGGFSFFPTKNLGAFGDGGLISIKNIRDYKKIEKLRTHGGVKRNQHDYIGYNSRLDEVQAAILNIKIEYIKRFIKNRIKIAKLYKCNINNPLIRLPYEDKNGVHTYNQFTIKTKNRTKLEQHLKEFNIPYGIYYAKPIYKYKAYIKDNYNPLPMAEKVSKQCLSLPIYPEMPLTNLSYICDVINEYKG